MILLVEDNKMNQLVGSKVLAKLGYAFDVANHGGEAVSAVTGQRRYDAVLMDCQMPEMDGYQATAEIRRIEGTARRTPIIAMTAAAMDGDRELCLAAGMDDYITKPVRLEAVAAVLERWATPAGARRAPEAGPGGRRRRATSPGPLDQAQIELLRSLDDGEGAVLSEIIDQYLAQTVEGRGDLVRVIGEGDAQALERRRPQAQRGQRQRRCRRAGRGLLRNGGCRAAPSGSMARPPGGAVRFRVRPCPRRPHTCCHRGT